MTTNTLDSPTDPATSENQPSGSRLVGGEVSLDVLRPLYLKNMAIKSQTDRSFVTFSRTQPDFPPVKKVNLFDKKRILVTGVSTIDSSLFSFSILSAGSNFFWYNLFLKIIRTTCEYLIHILGVGFRLRGISFGGPPLAHGSRCYLCRQSLHRLQGERRSLDWSSEFRNDTVCKILYYYSTPPSYPYSCFCS